MSKSTPMTIDITPNNDMKIALNVDIITRIVINQTIKYRNYE